MREEDRVAFFKIAVEEYRFQVLLNWDRTKHALVFNAAILGAATGLFKLEPSRGDWLVALVFLVGAVNSASGAHAVKVGHEYYREVRAKMIAHESALGLPEEGLAIATTPGMKENLGQRAKRPRLGNITAQFRAFLWMMAVVEFVAFVGIMARAILH